MRSAIQPFSSTRAMHQALSLILCLNALDAACTLAWVQMGVATEANPLMAWALNHSPAAFLMLKLLMVGFGVSVLWRNAGLSMARMALIPALVVYALIAGVHLGFALKNPSLLGL